MGFDKITLTPFILHALDMDKQMTLAEFLKCSIWTLVVAGAALPLALIFASGHVSGEGPYVVILAVFGSIFILPALMAWAAVGWTLGDLPGYVAMALAELAWVFWLVYLVRRNIARRRARSPMAPSDSVDNFPQ
jgi:hypothetical protein